MSEEMNRRSFVKKSALASAATMVGLSLQGQALSAKIPGKEATPAAKACDSGLPMGRIGQVKISRLIVGSNLFAGGAHSRDLRYVGALMKHYFTHEKVMDTLQLCEESGINTSVGGSGVKKYNKERGGKLQVIGQLGPSVDDPTSAAQRAIDGGAVGAFIWGKRAEDLVQANRLDVIEKFVSVLKKNGAIAGVGAHDWRVVAACEKAKIDVDFYFKTLHPDNYRSAYPKEVRRPFLVDSFGPDDHDCMWEQYPEVTIELMKTVKKPWIAYKVLAAGAVHPREGFKYAFDNGADFVCAGMIDFQIAEDVGITKDVLAKLKKTGRTRPWRG
ncbi:MAG: hypothetical protein ACYSTF_03990 [Planctomycetota bacterium]